MPQKIAENFINQIFDWVELSDAFDADINGLELMIKTNRGIYQINYHGVTKQIWVSSPLSGAHHFQYKEPMWLSTRDQDHELWAFLMLEFMAIQQGY